MSVERLTRKMLGGYGVIEGYELNTLHGAKAIINRLAAYENTGLTPEEVQTMMDQSQAHTGEGKQ